MCLSRTIIENGIVHGFDELLVESRGQVRRMKEVVKIGSPIIATLIGDCQLELRADSFIGRHSFRPQFGPTVHPRLTLINNRLYMYYEASITYEAAESKLRTDKQLVVVVELTTADKCKSWAEFVACNSCLVGFNRRPVYLQLVGAQLHVHEQDMYRRAIDLSAILPPFPRVASICTTNIDKDVLVAIELHDPYRIVLVFLCVYKVNAPVYYSTSLVLFPFDRKNVLRDAWTNGNLICFLSCQGEVESIQIDRLHRTMRLL